MTKQNTHKKQHKTTARAAILATLLAFGAVSVPHAAADAGGTDPCSLALQAVYADLLALGPNPPADLVLATLFAGAGDECGLQLPAPIQTTPLPPADADPNLPDLSAPVSAKTNACKGSGVGEIHGELKLPVVGTIVFGSQPAGGTFGRTGSFSHIESRGAYLGVDAWGSPSGGAVLYIGGTPIPATYGSASVACGTAGGKACVKILRWTVCADVESDPIACSGSGSGTLAVGAGVSIKIATSLVNPAPCTVKPATGVDASTLTPYDVDLEPLFEDAEPGVPRLVYLFEENGGDAEPGPYALPETELIPREATRSPWT